MRACPFGVRRGALIVCVLGCVARAPSADPSPRAVVEAAADRPLSLARIRTEVVSARETSPTPSEPQCRRWVEGLTTLFTEHGEPYVSALLDAGHIERWCGRPEAAVRLFKVVARDGPRWARARALHALADVDWANGDNASARTRLELALRFDPALEEAQDDLARVLTEMFGRTGADGLFRAAQALYRGRITSAPLRTRAGLARLYTLRAADQPAYAGKARLLLADADALARREGVDPPELHIAHGLLKLHHGDTNAALRRFEQACELEAADACAQAGLLLHAIRDWGAAAVALAKALRDPRFASHPDILRARASVHVQLEQFGRAEQLFDRLLEIDPGNPANHFDRANLSEVAAAAEPETGAREPHLAEAALHYRAFLRDAGELYPEGQAHAREFLRTYATP